MREETKKKVLSLAFDEKLNILNINDESALKLHCKCLDCGNEFNVSSKNFLDPRRTGRVCQKCNVKNKFFNKLNELYGKNPYTFITDFTGYNDKITVKCNDCGYEFTTKAANLLTTSNLPEGAHPCKGCTKERSKVGKNISELEAALIEKFGECNYTFPEPEKYKGLFSKEKFKIICKKCGHEMNTAITNILNPTNGIHYCRVCNKKDRLLENMSYKERCLLVTNNQIEPIDEYIDSKTAIRHKCNICGYGTDIEKPWYKVPVKNTGRNAGCPICSGNSTTSKAEDEIEEYIRSLDSNLVVERNTRDVLPSKQEIDLYVPEKKVGFEYNGKYWHSSVFKGKKYHSNKRIEAENVGIRLVQIFDDEWYFKKDIVKSKIKSILGYNKDSIYARTCKVVNISAADKNEFFDKYHIQGADKAAFSKALEKDGEIVAVMTLCKSRGSLGSDGSKYELSRYASKKHVVGGFSKLFKALTNENHIDSVITYADLRWSAPHKNVYETNGFILDHISDPNYWYFDTNASIAPRCHRYGFRKQTLKTKFPQYYKDELTEFQIMDMTSYRRVFDCGNLVFYWNR